MKIEEALATAIEYETRVREVYAEAEDETTHQVGKKVFRLLADEEDKHLSYLKGKLQAWRKHGELSSADLGTAVPSPERIAREIEKLSATLEEEDHGREIAMLEKAKNVEIETSGFYKKLTEELPEQGAQFFERFVAIEEGHLALVEAEITSLKGMGFWFDLPEFDLEAG